jgi:hypothetical protein
MREAFLLFILAPVFAKDLGSSSRIIGGNDASEGRYPYMVSVADSGAHKCGGTLVAPDVVMTAAHCVGFFNELQLGRYNLNDDESDYESYAVERIVTHPRYYSDNPAVSDDDPFDFALVKFYGETQIEPIRINRDPNLPANLGDQLVVTGWGTVDVVNGPAFSYILQEATVDYVPNEVCKSISAVVDNVTVSLESLIIDVSLCAIDTVNGQDTCTGDSGGPILIAGTDASEDIHVGLTSSGKECASEVFPGVYARTSEAIDWIDDQMCRLSSKPPADFGCPDVPRLPEISDDEVTVTIEIDNDLFPKQLGWIVLSTNDYGINVTYASRPFFTYSNARLSMFSESIKLPNNQAFTFLLLDQRSNGMCCSLGGLRIYNGPSFQEATEVYINEKSGIFEDYSVLPFDFTVGGLPTSSPTTTPAPSTTNTPSAVPTITRPYISIEIVLDEDPQETGWFVEALLEDEEVLLDVRYPGSYRKYKAGESVVEQVDLLPPRSSGPTLYRFTTTDNESNGLSGAGRARVYRGPQEEENLLFEVTEFFLEEEQFFSDEDGETPPPPTLAPNTKTPLTVSAEPSTSAPTFSASWQHKAEKTRSKKEGKKGGKGRKGEKKKR